jgi:SAM-dependent methyltransferase
MKILPDTHLDLGCGEQPRNPYQKAFVYGIDIRHLANRPNIEFKQANLIVEPIPFADNALGSVSAYDFLEHIPRVAITANGTSTKLPFLDLMNEVWRVLADGGIFYALTPAYPSPVVFQDPTHVNFITEGTHSYFCNLDSMGQHYGFHGLFRCIRAHRTMPELETLQGKLSWRQKWRTFRWRITGKYTHIVWEFEAIKPQPLP